MSYRVLLWRVPLNVNASEATTFATGKFTVTVQAGKEERAKTLNSRHMLGLLLDFGRICVADFILSDMKRYQFGGIQGDNFREFLNICFSHSNYFTLSKDVPNGYDLVPNSAEVALSPYLIKTVSTESWYGFEQISTNMVQNIYYSQKSQCKYCLTTMMIFSYNQKEN